MTGCAASGAVFRSLSPLLARSIAGPAANIPSEARLDMSWLATALVCIVRLLVGTVAMHGNLWPAWGAAFSMPLSWLVIFCNRLTSERQSSSTDAQLQMASSFFFFLKQQLESTGIVCSSNAL